MESRYDATLKVQENPTFSNKIAKFDERSLAAAGQIG
jgi:hypothetical protein